MIQYTKEYIANLLDKYMDGTSTLDEEAILSQYFRSKDIPEEWLCYQQLFEEIEAMAPQPKTRNRRWMVWSIAAAAVVAGVLYLAVPPRQTELVPTASLTAQADTTSQQTVAPTDTVTAQPVQTAEPQQPVKAKKRSLRKSEPTIHDYDKAYALMAEVEQAKAQAEQTKAKMELLNAQMAAYGYIPVMQEDGTIVYINEQEKLIAYEE
ncbi:MAG: hypothetical protein II886_03900 [Prevotella sp.]|nr:hypothetical protein [Prevotella sp.]